MLLELIGLTTGMFRWEWHFGGPVDFAGICLSGNIDQIQT